MNHVSPDIVEYVKGYDSSLGSRIPAVAPMSLSPIGTGDLIAIGAVVAAALAAVVALKQFGAAYAVARAKFLLDMDRTFDGYDAIRVRLAQQDQRPLTKEEWRDVKRYMARFERVGILISQGLLDPELVHRLYGPRFRYIVGNIEIRTRLLERKARSWRDFIQLWRDIDSVELRTANSHLCPDMAPPETGVKKRRWPFHGVRVVAAPDEEFDDEIGPDL